jgi:hypothetical protein
MKSSVRIVAISVILFGSGRAALAQPSLIVLNKDDFDHRSRRAQGTAPARSRQPAASARDFLCR